MPFPGLYFAYHLVGTVNLLDGRVQFGVKNLVCFYT